LTLRLFNFVVYISHTEDNLIEDNINISDFLKIQQGKLDRKKILTVDD